MIFPCGGGTSQFARPRQEPLRDNHSSKCYRAGGQGITPGDLDSALGLCSDLSMRICTQRISRVRFAARSAGSGMIRVVVTHETRVTEFHLAFV
jgi:hypothetical protein